MFSLITYTKNKALMLYGWCSLMGYKALGREQASVRPWRGWDIWKLNLKQAFTFYLILSSEHSSSKEIFVMFVYSGLLVLTGKKDACLDVSTAIRSIFRAFDQLKWIDELITLKWNPCCNITSLRELKVQEAITCVPNDLIQLSISPLSSRKDYMCYDMFLIP